MDWYAKLRTALPGCFIDDLSAPGEPCLTYFAGLTTAARLGSSVLTEQLRRGETVYAVRLELVQDASIAAVAFCRWQGEPTALETANVPYTDEQAAISDVLARLAAENGIALVSADELILDEE